MKRLITFAITIVAAFCLCACSVSVGDKTEKPNGLAGAFQASAAVTIENLEAQGTISRFGNGMWQAEFTSPNTLAGVKLEFSEGNVSASYKGLNFSVPQSALPVKAMMLKLMSAVDDLASNPELSGEEENGMLKITGSLEGGEYILITDDNGNIVSFEMPNNNLKIVFTDVVPIEGVSEGTSAAETSLVQETTVESTDAAESMTVEETTAA